MIFKTHVTALRKVRNRLNSRFTMSYSQLILGRTNSDIADKAVTLIDEAINLLENTE